jgi:hypothetical protein
VRSTDPFYLINICIIEVSKAKSTKKGAKTSVKIGKKQSLNKFSKN